VQLVTEFGGSTSPAVRGQEPNLQVTDEEMMRDAFIAHRNELQGLARRVLGSAHLAEEAVQETFARAWKSRGRFDASLGSVRTWLFSIERNLLIDLARTRARVEIQSSESVASAETVDDGIEKAMASWQVEEAIRGLTSEHRTVIVEMYFRGRTSKEMSAQLAIPEGTVRSRLFYALKAMKAILEETGWEAR
jgi:RNA polymerase sigma-70 factor (ECF subfamily)